MDYQYFSTTQRKNRIVVYGEAQTTNTAITQVTYPRWASYLYIHLRGAAGGGGGGLTNATSTLRPGGGGGGGGADVRLILPTSIWNGSIPMSLGRGGAGGATGASGVAASAGSAGVVSNLYFDHTTSTAGLLLMSVPGGLGGGGATTTAGGAAAGAPTAPAATTVGIGSISISLGGVIGGAGANATAQTSQNPCRGMGAPGGGSVSAANALFASGGFTSQHVGIYPSIAGGAANTAGQEGPWISDDLFTGLPGTGGGGSIAGAAGQGGGGSWGCGGAGGGGGITGGAGGKGGDAICWIFYW